MKNAILIVAGQGVSNFGSSVFMFALIWWITVKMGNTGALGIVMAISLIPLIAFSLFAGAIADRFNKKYIIVLTDLISGIACFLLALHAYNYGISYVSITITLVILSSASALFNPAVGAIIPEIIKEESVVRVNSASQLINSVARVLAPLATIPLLESGTVSVELICIINGASFIISAISESAIYYEFKKKVVEKTSSIIKDIKSGLHYVYKNQNLFMAVVIILFVNGALASNELIIPYLGTEVFDKPMFMGISYSLFSVGAILGSLLLSIINLKPSTSKIFILMLIMSVLYGLTILNNIYVVYAMYLIMGVVLVFLNILFMSLLQTSCDGNYLGRVNSVLGFSNQILRPVVLALTAIVISEVGSLLILIVTLVLLASSVFGIMKVGENLIDQDVDPVEA